MLRPFEVPGKTFREIADFLGAVVSDDDFRITGMTHSSKDVEPGDLFFGFPGKHFHGASFVEDAKKKGALLLVTDQDGQKFGANIPTIVVSDPRRTAGVLSSWFFGEPTRDIYSVGLTGTNGKTTTTSLLRQLWEIDGRSSGLIGTVETRIADEIFESDRTTPESCELQSLMATMRERHIRNVAMEVSSHSITLQRIKGSHFSIVGFTNLTQDHLDFHNTMEEYFRSKAELFTYEYADRAVINIDDSYGVKLVSICEIPVVTTSLHDSRADWYMSSILANTSGYEIAIRGAGGILIEGQLNLFGQFNLENALMAIVFAVESGVDPLVISANLHRLKSAIGRLESIEVGQNFFAFVDYGHTPDAITRVLSTCRELTQGRVIAVLGCGGDRDAGKRPLMGQALVSGSDISIFTSDNPRNENPKEILKQMVGNLLISLPSRIIENRSEAIEYAVGQALPQDLVIVLGKGHEKGQEIEGEILSFDDRLVLASAIEGAL